jgi:peptide/nickel transport system ATP-binding protein
MPEYLLNVIDLNVSLNRSIYPYYLLKKINFSLSHGQTIALVGESGSGKSITSLAIMQLLPLGMLIDQTSSIFFKNQDLLTFSEFDMRHIRGRKIALIFQEAATALNPIMTIGDQIIEVLKLHFRLTHKERRLRALELLKEAGVPNQAHYLKAYPHQLSGGLKQRALIAMALAGEPELLIADEPTTALDVTLQAQIIQLLKKLQEKRGMGLIFITHDLGVVRQVADQVMVLYRGEIVESASVHAFFKSPQHPYSHQLFASLPGWLQPPSHPATKQAKRLLTITDLKVYYPIKKGIFKRTIGYVKAVDNISLEVKVGRTLALVGESGSGKTTTGMAILKLTPITQGKIIFNNKDLSQLNYRQIKDFRRNLQIVFQDPYSAMNPRMLIRDIIAEGMGLRASKNTEAQIDQLLQHVGLEADAKYRYPHEFSGGQRQRICIARALAVRPKLLICDEPTSALDASSQMQVLQLLLNLQQEMGLTYLLITHNMGVVNYMADEIAVMYKGKIVETGPASHVLHQPKHPYTQKLLQAAQAE